MRYSKLISCSKLIVIIPLQYADTSVRYSSANFTTAQHQYVWRKRVSPSSERSNINLTRSADAICSVTGSLSSIGYLVHSRQHRMKMSVMAIFSFTTYLSAGDAAFSVLPQGRNFSVGYRNAVKGQNRQRSLT